MKLDAEYAAIIGDALAPVHALLSAAQRDGVDMAGLLAQIIHFQGEHIVGLSAPDLYRMTGRAMQAQREERNRAAHLAAQRERARATAEAEPWMEPLADELWPGTWAWVPLGHDGDRAVVNARIPVPDSAVPTAATAVWLNPARTSARQPDRVWPHSIRVLHNDREVRLFAVTPDALRTRYRAWLWNARPSRHEPGQLETLRRLAGVTSPSGACR